MLIILTGLTTALCLYSISIWSTRFYPSVRLFRYNQGTDIHVSEARKTTQHKTFAARHDLNTVIAQSLTDAESIKELANWVHSLWQPSSYKKAKSDNPMVIVSRAQNGEQFLRSDYAVVLAHAVMSVDIPCRLVSLNTRDSHWRPLASSYIGLEYFDREHFKWVWFDAQYGLRVLQNQRPLNAIEIKDAFLSRQMLLLDPDDDRIDAAAYVQKLAPFLDIVVAQPMGQSKRFALVPPQLIVPKKKWLVGRKMFDMGCHSVESFYASHPVKHLTQPVRTVSIFDRKTATSP